MTTAKHWSLGHFCLGMLMGAGLATGRWTDAAARAVITLALGIALHAAVVAWRSRPRRVAKLGQFSPDTYAKWSGKMAMCTCHGSHVPNMEGCPASSTDPNASLPEPAQLRVSEFSGSLPERNPLGGT